MDYGKGNIIKSKYILVLCFLLTIFLTVQMNMELISATSTPQNKTINSLVNYNSSINLETFTKTQRSVSTSNPTMKIGLSRLNKAAKSVNNYILKNHKFT